MPHRIQEQITRAGKAGISVPAVLDRAGLSRHARISWQKGKRSPSKPSQRKLAAALEATARDLLQIAAEIRETVG